MPIAAPHIEGIYYAGTEASFDLPVINLTDPRFFVAEDPAAAAKLYEAFAAAQRRPWYVPGFVMRMVLRSAARKSLLLKAILQPEGGFLDGISTYVMKLGPDFLVLPFDTPMDRRMASSPHVPLLRLRMQQTAQFLVQGLLGDLIASSAPLSLVNIGGGPALDSINAVLFLRRDHPELAQRPIAIHVLDGSKAGPDFGMNALAALQAEGAPLHGLSITMRHVTYDWSHTAPLQRLVDDLNAKNEIFAASTKGALFEYGNDADVIANLKVLRNGARLVTGSVTRDDAIRRSTVAETGVKLMLRGQKGLTPLAAEAGFEITDSESVYLSDQVLLRPAQVGAHA
ncbi:hypothetical protein ABLE91_00050 [Aquabacter sp. CN5-332]|uniref:hypothetical protein n=1 Tax=Aquabacter sp. CN5-332 TaxID=3156608 RepID=UPI0032B4179B